VGDSLEISTDTGNVLGFYEIASIDAADSITCYEEPLTGAIDGASSLSYETRTGVLISEKTDGSISDVDSDTGTLTSAGSDFDTDNALGDRLVEAGDMVIITAGPTSSVIGTYKVISVDSGTQLTLNTSDQNFPAGPEGGYTFTVFDRGMHLQYKSESVPPASNLDFNDADPDTIDRNDGGNFVTDGYVAGMAITVANADISANDGTYIVASVATTTLTLIAEETLTADTGDLNAVLTGEIGFIREISGTSYPFNWRLFANGGTLGEVFQFVQRELRRGRAGPSTLSFDIDEATTISRGDVTDLLMIFASPTGVTINMFLDDVNATELNNLTQQDLSGDSRNFAFLAGLTITLNSNILNDVPANGGTNKIVVYFTDPTGSAGDEFGTNGAIIVEDNVSVAMVAEDQTTSPLQFTFDYDNNAQGGRTPATDANVTIVCIGQDSAQYAQTTGVIQRANNNPFALVSSLERNYSNPV
jgi:hypothetical protein